MSNFKTVQWKKMAYWLESIRILRQCVGEFFPKITRFAARLLGRSEYLCKSVGKYEKYNSYCGFNISRLCCGISSEILVTNNLGLSDMTDTLRVKWINGETKFFFNIYFHWQNNLFLYSGFVIVLEKAGKFKNQNNSGWLLHVAWKTSEFVIVATAS